MPLPIPVIDGLLNIGNSIIERLWPDPVKAEEARMRLAEMAENGELQRLAMENKLLEGQIAINLEEAKSGKMFIGGWRPAIGWTCAVSLFCYYVPYILIATILWAHRVWVDGFLYPRPDLGIADLLGLVGTLLGMSVIRTKERLEGKIPPQK